MLAMLQANQQDNGQVNLQLADLYRQQLLAGEYQHYQHAEFMQMAADSLAEQQQIEAADTVGFDQYLQQYFAEKPC
jgi:glutamate--cysteine ligase